MSSLRNAVKRVTHKERSQPQSRSRLGLLEKKKDYVVRAKDYHLKEDRIAAMRRKASMRNPDEFYFGMNRAEVRDGKHKKTDKARMIELEGTIGPDAVRIMKEQDLKYVRMQRQKDEKKIERLRSSLHFLEGSGGDAEMVRARSAGKGKKFSGTKRKHTIFLAKEEEASCFDVAAHFGTVPELAGRAFNRPRVETLSKIAADAEGRDIGGEEEGFANKELSEKEVAKREKHARRIAKKMARARAAAYREMEERAKRAAAMEAAEAHLVTEKNLAGKGRKRKISGAEGGKPAVYKWQRKRAK